MRTLRTLQAEGRAARPGEQTVLARWSGWGAVPAVFDTARTELAPARDELQTLLTDTEYAAARRSTLNAHYTDASIAAAMWDAATELGFAGGTVLEPGCGAGTFIGLAPEHTRMVGIEVDPTTAAIAGALYPQATVRSESFADTRAPEASFDLAIGNVPFAKLALTDARHNSAGHSIHNHFLIKSLRLTRPGGLVIALTSRYTLDAQNPAARQEMAQYADLLGAVRLPTGAHQRAAGTQVVTDVLVLRRRDADQPGNGESWERTAPLTLPTAGTADERDDATETVEINQYFQDHPEQVLGISTLGHGAYRSAELIVTGEAPAARALPGAFARISAAATSAELGYTPRNDRSAATPDPAVTLSSAAAAHREGLLSVTADGGFTRVRDGAAIPHQVPRTQVAELRALLGLRDTTLALLDAESATGEDTAQITELRADLGRRYDAYTDAYGPVRRFTWRRTGYTDPETGEPRLARNSPPQGGFRTDPYSPVVRALEDYDEATGVATRAEVFSQRVVAPRVPRVTADSPADALAICLDTYGEVRLPEIAQLLDAAADAARDQLGDLVFDEPPTAGPDSGELLAGPARLVAAAEYLSGNVRIKLAAATAAATTDPRFATNVTALRPVIPADLGPAEIHARLGVPWIPATYVEEFLRETLDDPNLRVEHPGGTIWAVKGTGTSVAATSEWGTTRRAAPTLAEAALEQRSVRVYDEDDDGRRWLNTTETLAAQEKMAALDARFGEWVWEDPDRADTLARTYNERFNHTALRSYEGAELSLPGVALTFRPRPHQVAAVARMITEPAVGLFHEVGAGKTAEMVMGTMELRRLGMVRKPAIVVPNHMLDQFAREFLEIYPRANILPAGRDELKADRRRDFVARAATGDWDAIILTRSAFEKLPMSPEHQTRYQERESERVKEWIERTRAGGESSSLTIKRMEGILARAEERLKTKLDSLKDPGLTFEQTGIDWVAIDEAHDYKNLRTLSNIPDAAVDGADRATDLHMKLDYLRQRHGGRVGVLATATPIANSVTEAHVMQRYLRPDLLESAGVEDFDSWAATFGEVVTGIELAPDGGQPRMKSRFARFKNVPELLRMWHVSADVKTADDLKLPVPDLAAGPDGKRAAETVVVPGTEALASVVADLVERSERIRGGKVERGKDNMLTITGLGRAAALDLRLVGASTTETTKLDVAADRIAALWNEHRTTPYMRPEGGEVHPTPGALQLVFSDLGTPSTDEERFDVYRALRASLHERGLPEGSVRFMHEARNDVEKAALFQAARTGQIAVLIGSTQRMGVGTNVQNRAVALHHLDCPWRPADIAQREGRIIRQRNQNPEVKVLRYVTEGSFDAYSWQTVTRKAGFIAQIMRGRLDVREIEDIGDAALSYDEVKALATGDPRVLDKAKADAEVTRLDRLERAHHRNREHLVRTARSADRTATTLGEELDHVHNAISRRVDTRADAFRIVIGTRTHTSRAEAGRALQDILGPPLERLDRYSRATDTRAIAELGGHTVTAALRPAGDDVVAELSLAGVPRSGVTLERDQLRAADPAGLIQRLENKLTGLDRIADTLTTEIENARHEGARARVNVDASFPHAEQLAAARHTAAELEADLTARVVEHERPVDAAPSAPAAPEDGPLTTPGTTSTGQGPAADQLTGANRGAITDQVASAEGRTERRASPQPTSTPTASGADGVRSANTASTRPEDLDAAVQAWRKRHDAGYGDDTDAQLPERRVGTDTTITTEKGARQRPS